MAVGKIILSDVPGEPENLEIRLELELDEDGRPDMESQAVLMALVMAMCIGEQTGSLDPETLGRWQDLNEHLEAEVKNRWTGGPEGISLN